MTTTNEQRIADYEGLLTRIEAYLAGLQQTRMLGGAPASVTDHVTAAIEECEARWSEYAEVLEALGVLVVAEAGSHRSFRSNEECSAYLATRS